MRCEVDSYLSQIVSPHLVSSFSFVLIRPRIVTDTFHAYYCILTFKGAFISENNSSKK